MLTSGQCRAYLDRIGCVDVGETDFAALSRLQARHLLCVPFENLSIARGETIRMREDWLFDKIVTRKRGGFCYELNGLFAALLRTLGYGVDRVAAEVWSDARGQFGRPYDHMALLVRLPVAVDGGSAYLVDVGFGDSARGPLPMPDGGHTDVSGRYRLRAARGEEMHPPPEQTYVLERQRETGWQIQYRFTTRPCALDDYSDACFFQQTSSDSSFTRGDLCTIARPDGRITLSSTELTRTVAGHKTVTPLGDATDFDRYLREYFGVTL